MPKQNDLHRNETGEIPEYELPDEAFSDNETDDSSESVIPEELDSESPEELDSESPEEFDSESVLSARIPEELDSESVLSARIPEELDGSRLDTALGELFPRYSRSFWQNRIGEGLVTLDNAVVAKTGKKGKAGQVLCAVIPQIQSAQILPEEIPLDILYEDSDVIVINKPKGMVVHPAAGHSSGTLVNALMAHCQDSLSGINGVLRPGIVHRIDRDTTGSLVVAKNDAAHLSLARQFKDHSITRTYRAIVHGRIPQDTLTIDAPVGRHPRDRKKMAVLQEGQGTSRRAVTHVKVLERFAAFTYIECTLETGRTHQIRVHMSHIGHPVLGDEVYGPKKCPFRLEGQTLHAMVLGFVHPATNIYMEFTAPLPEYFEMLLKRLQH